MDFCISVFTKFKLTRMLRQIVLLALLVVFVSADYRYSRQNEINPYRRFHLELRGGNSNSDPDYNFPLKPHCDSEKDCPNPKYHVCIYGDCL